MRKHVFLMLSMAAMLLMPMFSNAQTVYFTDGFENGLDERWTQEYYNAATGQWVTETPDISQPWKTESAAEGTLTYPNGAAKGSGRAYFRQEAAAGKNVQTTGYRTRLITPKMNLSGGYQPILRFYHAQAKWTADFDTLRVYYRQGAETQWELLSEYTSYIQKWTFEEIDLKRTGDDYQIAFEANENMGRGIVLDSVIIRTKPQITTPHDMAFYDMRDNGVNLTWEASKDADSFRVVVAEIDLDLNVYAQNIDSVKYIVLDTVVSSEKQDVRLENLAGGRTYYMQVQSIGEFENSAWSETYSFRMKPVVNITLTQGYFEDFNIPYKSNAVKDMQLETWEWGGDKQPMIPTWIGEENYYMYSPDASGAVVFTGENKSSSGELTYTIPAGQVQYIVSPEISGKDIPNFSMSMCHVTFWGTTYKYQQGRAKSIIVGIVSDPKDPTTFVPVDTCTVWGYMHFTWFDVDLSSYTGDGRYVAFVTNFQDKDNWFALDKVTIEVKPAIAPVVASDIKVIPTTTEAQLSWPAVEGATSYKVKYLAMPRKGAKIALEEDKMAGAVTVTANTNAINLSELTARTKYAYSVQAVKGDDLSTWSQPREFYTSAVMEIPKKYEFEESEDTYSREGEAASELFARDWCVFTNDADAPYLYTSYYKSGSRCLYLVKDQYNDAWTVAPMIENVKDIEVVFYARLSSTSYPNSNVVVGVMEDPSDLKTFTPITTCTPSGASYERFYVNFTNYTGTGKYVALLWGENGVTKNGLCIDDLTFRGLANCFAPTMEIQTTDSSAVLTWKRNDETDRYHIKVSNVALTEEQIPLLAKGDSVFIEYEEYDGDSLFVSGLTYSTQYYVYAQTLCSETDHSDWSGTSFKTDCPEIMSLPYKNDFESENYSGSNSIPACWLKPTWTTTSSVYPYLSSSYNHDPSGEGKSGNSLCMTSSTTYGSTIALPKFDADLENVKLRFWLYYGSAGYKVFAGVMGNTNDPEDFYPVDTFTTVASTWVLCEATFTAEDLKHGQYLAISSYTGASNYGYIDDIEVINMINEPPFNYQKVDAGTNWFEVKWDGKTTDKWAVAVTNKNCGAAKDFNPEAVAAENLVELDTVATNGYKVEDGLKSLTWYYIYAKSTAGESWSLDSIQTECTVWNPRVKSVQGFEVDAAGNDIRSTTSSMSTTTTYVNYFKNAMVPECWTVGNVLDGTDFSKLTSSGYIPYICTDGTGSSANPTTYADKAGTSYQYSTDGVNSLKVYSYRTTSATTNRAPAWAAMNKLDCSDEDLKSLILTFDYQMATTATYALVVGIMDDPTDLSTFTVLDSIPGAKGTGTGSHKHASAEIALDQYEGTGRYIAFRGPYTATTTFYLDNVSVSLATCPNPKPSMSQVTDSSAVLASGLRVDNGWKYIVTDIMYQAANLDAGEMPDAEHIVAQANVLPQEEGDPAPKMQRINGLSANTDYYVYVTTLCEGDEISAWKMVSFTTLCAPESVTTWVGNFANDTTATGYNLECWIVGNISAGAAVASIPNVVKTTRKDVMADSTAYPTYDTNGKADGAKVLRLYATSTAVGPYAVTKAMLPEEGKTLQDYQVVFKGYGTSGQSGTTTSTSYAHNLRVGVAIDPSDPSTMTILDTIALPVDVKKSMVDLSWYKGEGKYIVFYMEKEAATYSQAFIYDIHLEPLPSCKLPRGLKASEITHNAITLTWNGQNVQYNVALSTKSYTDEEKAAGYLTNDSVIAADGILFQTVDTTVATFTGLKDNAVYYAYLQGNCGNGDLSEWVYDYVALHTECIPEQPVPLKENFEKYAASTYAVDCWDLANYGGTGYPKILKPSTGAVSGSQLELWSTGTSHRCVAIMPKVVGNLSDYILSFDSRSLSTTTASVLYVGTMSDIADSTTFVPFDTVYMAGGNEFEHRELVLSNYTLAHDRIAFSSGLAKALEKNSDMYIDNIRLGYPISCFAPQSIAISNEGFTSADLTIIPRDTLPGTWEIEVTKASGATKTYLSDTTFYTLNDLEPSSTYSVIVRKSCDGDYSEDSDPISFSTKWTVDTYKWTFSLNEQGTVSKPNKTGAAIATYPLHPALTPTASVATLNYSSNTSYLPYQIMNSTTYTYAQDNIGFVAGQDTARALRLYRYYSTSYAYGDSATVILPPIVHPNGKQLSFDVRFGYAYSNDYSTVASRNVVYSSGVYPKAELCIGTVDSLKGLETYQEIIRVKPSPLVGTDTLRAASNYGWQHYVLPLDMDLTGKQLALMIQSPKLTGQLYIDNLAIEESAPAGFTTPQIISAAAGDTYATIKWIGNAESYNIYVVDTAYADSAQAAQMGKYIPYLQDAPAACVRKIENVTGNSYKVTGLTAGGNTYEFYVEDAANAALNGALSNRAFATTVCPAVAFDGSYSYDFEPGPNYKMGANPSKSTADGFSFQWPSSTTVGDTVYKTPECWNYGISVEGYDKTSSTYKSYNPTLRSNSMTAAAASQYVYARNGYSCMQFYGSSSYKEVYAVMPLMTGYDPDTLEINFWGRCTYHKVQGGTIASTTYLKGTSYSTKLAVGTMTDPEDPKTFVALDTIEYDYTASDLTTSTVASSDPTGNSYWLNFTVPMKGAKGQYIAFKQVGYGYFYMDDLSIRKRQTARRPWNLEVIELGSTTAKVAWKGEEMAEGGKYIIEVSNSATNWETPTTYETTSNTFEITGLEVAKQYFFRVKQEGSIYGNTDFAHYVAFTTECLPLNPNGYETGFECDNETDPWTVVPGATGTNVNTLKQNQCWTYWAPRTNSTSITTGYRPYNIVNTASYGYSHSGDYALKLYETVSTVQQAVVSPLIGAEIGVPGVGFDTLQLTFWACPSYRGMSGTNKDKITSAQGTAYAKYIEIGTCTDPTDTTTYTVLAGWTYEVEGNNLKTGMQADKNNDYAFQKVTVKLNEATGPYVFIRGNHLRDGQSFSSGSTMYIDDLKFEKLLNCQVPENVEAVEVTTRNAKVQWTGDALSYDLQVSADPTFTDEAKSLVDTTDLNVTSFYVEGLEPAKQYYFRVKAYCDAAKKDASDWTMTANFKTPYAPLYIEDFTMSLSDWRMAYGYANKVFAGKAAPRDTTLSSTYNSWYRVQNLAMSGYAVRALLGYAASANPSYPISSTYQSETYYQKYWLISPSITIEKESAQLAFEAALTHYTTADPIYVHDHWNEGWDNQFMVIISEDDGQTWKQENAVIWNNETTNDKSDAHYKYGIGDYKLTDIPAEPTQLSVDLTKYTGKTIRIAFYAENTDQNSLYGIHVDKIHVNYLTKNEETMSLCQFEDIEDVLGFDINGDTVSAGEMQLKRSVLSYENGKNDSLFILNVDYKEAPQYYYEITICEGTPFEYMGFNQHTAPGTYRMKLQSVVTGCDSIVNFTIKHAATLETTIDTTICYGTYIDFNGQKYNEAGKYVAYLKASEKFGGCDSIVTLNLSVTTPILTSLNPSICAGSEYYWEGADTTLTTRGTYTKAFPASNGCDSMVTVTLSIIDPVRGQSSYQLPEGGSYTIGDSVITAAGTYDIPSGTAVSTGCDSITEWTVTIIPAPVYPSEEAICSGSTYTFAGKELSEAGVYRDTVYAPETHYMSINELHLSINPILNNNLGTKYINEGESYDFYGKALKTTGSYYDTVASVVTGCDSINYINLIVLTDTVGTESKTICSSELPIEWKGMTLTKEGTYTFDTLTVYGTDSLVVLALEVIQPVTSTVRAEFCEGGSYELNNKIYSLPGTYYDTVVSAVTGCDSIITLVLTRNAAPVIPQSAKICAGSYYQFGDKQLSAAGIYRDTVYAEGTHCMEITELTLSVIQPVSTTIIANICAGESYDFNGQILKETGSYSDTLTAITGCDSIIYLTLNVSTLTIQNIAKSICEGDIYPFAGKDLTEAGTYYDTIRNRFECDSMIIALKLNVNKATTYDYTYNLCAGGVYEFFGQKLTKAGDYTDTIANKAGCDSIVTVHLVINDPLTGTQRAQFCGASYTYQGVDYDEGTHEVWIKNEKGCDSIVTLILTRTYDVYDTLNVTLCAGETYSDEHFTVNKPGIYSYDVAQAGGCTYYYILNFRNFATDTTMNVTVTTDELPYQFLTLYYGPTTEPGVYNDTVESTSAQGCDLLIYHVLTVIKPEGIDNIFSDDSKKTMKVIYNDHMYIIRRDGWYNASGQKVSDPRK